MASSSVSQDDHDVEHEFAIAARKAKVRSARVRAVHAGMAVRGLTLAEAEQVERDNRERELLEPGETSPRVLKYDTTSVVLVEQNDASPKPLIRGLNKEKRSVPRGGHAGKSNKGVRDRRKLREKRRSTAIGVMHLPSTESTGGSTGEDENDENSLPTTIVTKLGNPNLEQEEKAKEVSKGKSESDLDANEADDEAAQDSSDVRRTTREDESSSVPVAGMNNHRLTEMLVAKDRRIAALEIQVEQLTRQIAEIRDENSKLLAMKSKP